MRGIEEMVDFLGEDLKYVKHEVSGNRVTIWVKSAKKKLIYLYCEKIPTNEYLLQNWFMRRYPLIEGIINLVNEFKKMLKSKNVEKVEEWIEKSKNQKVLFIKKCGKGSICSEKNQHSVSNSIGKI